MSPSCPSPNLIVSIAGGDHSSLNFASLPLPPSGDPRIILPIVPQETSQAEVIPDLDQYIASKLIQSPRPPSHSLLLQVLAAAMWRKNLHRELLNAIVAAIPLGSPYTLCELVLYGLIFPTLEELVSTCQIHSNIRSLHLVGVRWLGPGVLPNPAKNHVTHTTFQITELRISERLESDGGVFLLDGLKSTLTKLVLDVPAASNIAGSGSEVPPRRENTIVMVQLTSFVVELGMMRHPLVADGQTEREAEVISKAVDSDLAKVRPLFDRVVMPNADVLLRLRLEPTDVASEADLNHDASEFVQGRGAFSAVENLGPSVRGFSNFLQERHRGVVSKVSRRRV